MEMTDFNIPNYTLIKKIGEGGMATVYLGQHLTLQRKVAIKIINKDLANTPDIRKRFINEARMLSELNHKNIVTLYDFMEMPDNLCLIMEYVEGASLDNFIHKINKGPIPEGSAIEIFKQILEGFAYAHRKGIVHRDIKPSNIILTPDYTPKILDFGIAKIMQSDNRLTRTGTKMGSILYMSPEQVKGLDVDYRSDIYSLGVTLYEMLAGKIPYENYQSDYEIQNDIVLRALPDITLFNPNVSKNIQSIIAKATAKNPEDRFQSCEEFKEAFNYKVDSNIQNTSAKTIVINPEQRKSEIEPKRKNKNLIIIISGIMILVVVIVVAVIGFTGNKDSSEKQNSSSRITKDKENIYDNSNKNYITENEVMNTIYEWEKSQNDINIPKYISFYANDFYGIKRTISGKQYNLDYNAWIKDRTVMYSKAAYLNVICENIKVSELNQQAGTATVSFIQTYISTNKAGKSYNDKGRKILKLRKEPNSLLKIYYEELIYSEDLNNLNGD